MRSNPQQDIGVDVKGVLSLQGRELDRAVAPLAGWSNVVQYMGSWEGYPPIGPYQSLPRFSTSLDAIRPVIEKLHETEEGKKAYAKALFQLMQKGPKVRPILLATAEDQCRAILLAYAEKEKKG